MPSYASFSSSCLYILFGGWCGIDIFAVRPKFSNFLSLRFGFLLFAFGPLPFAAHFDRVEILSTSIDPSMWSMAHFHGSGGFIRPFPLPSSSSRVWFQFLHPLRRVALSCQPTQLAQSRPTPHTYTTRTLHSYSTASHDANSSSYSPSSTASTAAFASTSTSSSSSSSVAPSGLYHSFDELGLDGPLLHRLTALQILHPTPIQQRVLLSLRASRSSRQPVLIQSPTGSGKSLAFLLPVLQRVLEIEDHRRRTKQPRQHVSVVLLCPTQELAFQTQAQIRSLLSNTAAETNAKSTTTFDLASDPHCVGLAVGGVDSIESQREALLANPPAILVANPKRLNQIIFPQYDTHQRPPRLALFDPDEEELLGESHAHPHSTPRYLSAQAAAALVQSQHYATRNNVAVVGDGVRSEKAPIALSAVEAHHRLMEQDDRDEADGIKSEYLPPRDAVGYEAQRFLCTPSRLARERLRSKIGKQIFSHLIYLVIDEIDHVLKPMTRHPSDKDKQHRQRHPKPGQVLVKGLQLLNPNVQLIGASATIGNQLTQLMWNLGFRQRGHKPMILRVEARQHLSAFQGEMKSQPKELRSEDVPLQLESSISDPTSSALESGSSPLARTGPSSLESPFSSSKRSLEPHVECPPNIAHFYVLAPSETAWLEGAHWKVAPDAERIDDAAGGDKLPYDHLAPAEERQRIHQHNMQLRWAQRRSAWVMDKLCTLQVLTTQFRPKCCIVVIDEIQHRVSDIQRMCETVGLKSTPLFKHLSSPDVEVRKSFFDDLAARRYDVLLVGLESVRGLDLPQCDLVVNLTALRSSFDYLHSAGRTGRFGRTGSVINLLHPEEVRNWQRLTLSMPKTLGEAKQITLPKQIDSEMLEKFISAYYLSSNERQTYLDRLDKDMKYKLRKKVTPDSEKSSRAKKILHLEKKAAKIDRQTDDQHHQQQLEDNSDTLDSNANGEANYESQTESHPRPSQRQQYRTNKRHESVPLAQTRWS